MKQNRLLKYCILICIIISMLSGATVWAESAKQHKEGIFTYIIEDGVATITNVDDVQKVVSVPSILGKAPVKTLAGGAFGGSVMIEEVILPDSVSSIESMCFSYCTELVRVTLPKNLSSIENGVFNHCTKLDSIILPDTIKTIEKDAFYRCDQLRTITIPNGVISIGENAFASCPNLSAATIPESVKEIGQDAFQNSSEFCIYAKPKSAAEDFANMNEIPFEELITVTVNDEEIYFDQPPITDKIQHRTLVPLRAVMESLDAKIVWDEKTDISQLILPDFTISIQPNKSSMYVNQAEYQLSTPVIEFNWRTMVPIRDIIEAIGGIVSWNEEDKHINITIN